MIGRSMSPLLLVLGLAILAGCHSAPPRDPGSAEDYAAIERMHEKDEQAARDQDFDALRTVLSRDVVLMPPGQRAVRGRSEWDSSVRSMRDTMTGVEILEYEQFFEEVRVIGDYAFEWGTVVGTIRPPEGGEPVQIAQKLMRILKRGDDGKWRVHRSMWNEGS